MQQILLQFIDDLGEIEFDVKIDKNGDGTAECVEDEGLDFTLTRNETVQVNKFRFTYDGTVYTIKPNRFVLTCGLDVIDYCRKRALK